MVDSNNDIILNRRFPVTAIKKGNAQKKEKSRTENASGYFKKKLIHIRLSLYKAKRESQTEQVSKYIKSRTGKKAVCIQSDLKGVIIFSGKKIKIACQNHI